VDDAGAAAISAADAGRAVGTLGLPGAGAAVATVGSAGASDVFQNCHERPAHPVRTSASASDPMVNSVDLIAARIVVLLFSWSVNTSRIRAHKVPDLPQAGKSRT